MPATQGLGMFVEVKDPDDKVNTRLLHHLHLPHPRPRASNGSRSPAGDPVPAVRL